MDWPPPGPGLLKSLLAAVNLYSVRLNVKPPRKDREEALLSSSVKGGRLSGMLGKAVATRQVDTGRPKKGEAEERAEPVVRVRIMLDDNLGRAFCRKSRGVKFKFLAGSLFSHPRARSRKANKLWIVERPGRSFKLNLDQKRAAAAAA